MSLISIVIFAPCLLEAVPLRGTPQNTRVAFGNSPEGYSGRPGSPQEPDPGVGLEPSRR